MTESKFNLMKQFIQFNRLLHSYQNSKLRCFGPLGNPYRGQGRVLALLKMKPEITQKELAFLLDMRGQSLGELLSKLERSDYITREPSEADRRVMNVKLTEAGAEAAEQAQDAEYDSSNLFDVLSEEEQNNLHDYMQRVTDELEKQLADMPEGSPDFMDPRMHGRGGRPGFGREGFGGFRRGGHGDPRFAEGHPGFDGMRGGMGPDRFGERPMPERDFEDREQK
ncbi:MarR family transcriptional regulator [Listeria booriae]|uniref:MarR family transcriptional regulator n=1 Tax=Listeria booriae TaxID=1552123 RepID=A0A7X0XFW3_9LIST|nr:helix-turn-helix domain-containing protein [Listeria booriae]MBC1493461.1 MarR family transcriptional regulator [Listeria booriae]MBC1504947.1 MarR family transcriptional regulator [Listeria booriae]MBC1525754.1 MarR family transcriptional regulator [Listeria booriae]MBC1531632.1 MarR family transcriptional regulator [Listeria booriae]MBC6136131.1 MarR family transcriptional regulator [Listeria booriae]